MARRKAGDNQATDQSPSDADGVENTPNVQADHNSIAIGGISIGGGLSGEVNIATGDIIKNINTIHQRALTAAEEAAHASKRESKLLAQGVSILVQSLSVQVSQGTEHDNPYKGLLSYSLSEAVIFYGRNEAKKDLLNCITQGSLTVLHAESGAGKSSLLQAGIAAQLISNGHLALHLRPHKADPVEFIKRMFMPELTQTPTLAGASLREFLRQVCAVLGTKVNLYLLLDQFEEFFHLLKKDERQLFLESLSDCLNDPSLKVRWVLALRAEALSDLAELEAFGITPFKNMYRLNRLSRDEAQEAISEPAKRYGIQFEPALIEYILETLTTNEEVVPTHLQLVCSALTDDLLEEKTLTLAYYTDHEGGTEGILRDYLKRRLEDLPAREQALAWKVLRALITADRQRAVKTSDEIIQELKGSSEGKEQINMILGRLIERRLLFTQPAATETFELAHDYLVKEIQLDPQEQARKAAQELLDQETRTYQRHKTLLTAERLAVIEPYRNELRLSADAEVLLSESQKAVQVEQRVRERRRNITVGISIAVAIGMALLAIWGFRSSEEATKQAATANVASTKAVAQQATAQSASALAVERAEEAQKQTTIARAGELSAESVALRENNFSVSLLLGIEAFKMNDAVQTRSVLLDNLQINPQLNQFLNGHFDSVFSVAFSPDGKILASGSAGAVILWDVDTGQPIDQLHTGDLNGVYGVAFSPDGKILASRSDYNITLWNMITHQPIGQPLRGQTSSIAFSPDGKILASGSDYNITLWDVTTQQSIGQPLKEHTFFGNKIVFSPDGKILASGGDTSIILWDMTTHQPIGQPLRGQASRIAFSPDGKTLATSSHDNNITLWDVKTYQTIRQPLKGHAKWVSSIVFSPDGKILASGSDDNTVILWDVDTGQPIDQLHTGDLNGVYGVAFSPEGKTIVSGGGNLILWKIGISRIIGQSLKANSGVVSSIAFTLDGKILASGNEFENTTTLWDVETQLPLRKLTVALKLVKDPNKANSFIAYTVSVLSVSFSPDGKILASGSDDNNITLWDVGTGQPIGQPLRGHTGPVDSVTFSPDGKILASGSEDKTIILWDVKTKQIIGQPLDRHTGGVTSVSFSPDGKILASSSWDETIILWDIDTRQPIGKPLTGRKLCGSGTGITPDIAFSPDGKLIAAGDGCKSVLLWEVRTGQLIGEPLTGHTDSVYTVAFSPDGKMLASGSDDNTVILWDVRTAQRIGQPLRVHEGWIYSVAFSPNGKLLASGSWDNTIILWDVDPLSWVQKTCQRVGRNFTRVEWTQYFPNEEYRVTCPKVLTDVTQQALSNIDDPNRVQTAISKVSDILKENSNSGNVSDLAKKIVKGVIKEQISNSNLAVEDIKSHIRLLQDAKKIGLKIDDAADLNSICWYGSIYGYAKDVLEYCEQVVALAPDDAGIRDSRGLARALTGNLSGAIEDFQFFVDSGNDTDKKRQGWIIKLKIGENPFTPDVLEDLK